MPEFKLSKEAGTKKFELSIAIDYDEDGNIEAQEFYDGVDWSDNPADIRLNTSYCDEDEQDEWNLFFNDFMHLLESNELTEKAETLKYLIFFIITCLFLYVLRNFSSTILNPVFIVILASMLYFAYKLTRSLIDTLKTQQTPSYCPLAPAIAISCLLYLI